MSDHTQEVAVEGGSKVFQSRSDSSRPYIYQRIEKFVCPWFIDRIKLCGHTLWSCQMLHR